MTRVLCILDDTPLAARTLETALERAHRRGAELALVGVVSPAIDAPSPASGERIRRFGLVQANLVRAARQARSAGVVPTVALRDGDLRTEARAVAREVGADEVVLAEPRRFLRRGGETVVVSLAREADREPARELVAA
ncbi:MAG: universal stress protein [Gaiellaceae bacterium]